MNKVLNYALMREKINLEHRYTRRELAGGIAETALSKFRKTIQNLRSENSPGNKKMTIIDEILEKGSEFGSTAMMVNTAVEGSRDALVVYGVKAESTLTNSLDLSNKLLSFRQLQTILNPMTAQIDQLGKAWEKAYYEYVCRMVTKSGIDSKGNPTVTVSNECDYEWQEPWQVTSTGLNHNKISSWKNKLITISTYLDSAINNAPVSFDVESGESNLFYPEKKVDSNLMVGAIGFGCLGTAFSYYEEILNKATAIDKTSWNEKDDDSLISDKKYKKRRAIMKLLGTYIVTGIVRQGQLNFIEENRNLLNEIKEKVKQSFNSVHVDPETNFQRYFNTTPQGIRGWLIDIHGVSTKALDAGGFLDFDWKSVSPYIKGVIDVSETTLSAFDKYFSLDKTKEPIIPQNLTDVTKSVWLTKDIESFVNGKNNRIFYRSFIDGFKMLFGLGFIAGVAEKILFPVSDKILNGENF